MEISLQGDPNLSPTTSTLFNPKPPKKYYLVVKEHWGNVTWKDFSTNIYEKIIKKKVLQGKISLDFRNVNEKLNFSN